jgi:hypothetical protein
LEYQQKKAQKAEAEEDRQAEEKETRRAGLPASSAKCYG